MIFQNHTRPARPHAFTLVEVMVAMAVLGIALSIGLTGWAHLLVGEKRVETQNELDMDVRSSMEHLRADLRLSDVNKIVFYPAGIGPYSAISFPVSSYSSTALDNATNLIWSKTVVYHIFASTPNQLKRTVFNNRNPDATVSNRQVQLNQVVATGHGANACLAGETSSTSTLFQNLFFWNLTPNSAQFDCYAATTMRDRYFFGSTTIGSGSHTVEFKVIGKNPLGNANRHLGIDVLNCSVSGSDQEAEDQTFTAINGTPTLAKTYVPTGSWSGNYHMQAQCTTNTNGQGVSVTVQNDCWTESNFETPGALADNTSRDFDKTLSPYYHYVMRLSGATGNVWWAGGPGGSADPTSQCNDSCPDNLQNTPLNVCMRVHVRGEYIKKNGHGPILMFSKTTANPVLLNPTFAIADVGAYSNTCNAVTGTVQSLRFYQDGQELPWSACDNGTVYAMPVTPIDIYPNQSYLVSYYLQNVGGARNMYHNEDYRNPGIGSYVLTNSTLSNAFDTVWSTNACLTTDYTVSSNPGKIYSLYKIASAFVSTGTYTSIIFDSGQSAATAKTISWSVDVPNNTCFNLFARTGDASDLSDAVDWADLSPITATGAFPNNTGRYVQFRAVMGTNPLIYPYPPSPRLKWVTFQWPGDTRLVDVAGVLTRGTDYAQCQVTVDGKPLTRSIKMDLTIYKDVRRIGGGMERLTSFITAEVMPRNTGL